MLTPTSCQGLLFGEACLLEEYYFLFGISALVRPTHILEIGASSGLGTAALWWGAHCANHREAYITTIEINPDSVAVIRKNWTTLKMSQANLNILVGDSRVLVPKLKAAGRKFGLCFIDGSHAYEYARADWDNTQGLTNFWVMHDSTQMPGVRRLISEIRATDKYNVFEFGQYPFGTQWFASANSYGPKKSIPGITLVTSKNAAAFPISPEEQAWVDLARVNG